MRFTLEQGGCDEVEVRNMKFGGIDVGSLTAQAVILENGHMVGFKSIRVRNNPVSSAEAVMGELLEELSLSPGDLSYTVSTGYGREQVQERGLSQANVSEITCHGVGAHWLMPEVRTVIDIGGQDAKVIRLNASGDLEDFVMNDKCAAGTGRFLEVMARTLGLSLEELGPVSKMARNRVALSSRCSIFCETEVLRFLQRGAEKADIAAGVNRAMAERVAALVRRVGAEPEVTMSGGVAKNPAVKEELERILGIRIRPCPVDPQIVGALGAAVLARRMGGGS
jgi:predicted CoA-substrate-specific enzyme activase